MPQSDAEGHTDRPYRIPPREINVLVLAYLKGQRYEATDALEAEMQRKGQLPVRTDYTGRESAMSYADICRKYPQLGSHSLGDFLEQHLQTKGNLGLAGILSQLTVRQNQTQWTQSMAIRSPIFSQYLREIGISTPTNPVKYTPAAKLLQKKYLCSTPNFASKFKRQATLLGHSRSSFCVAFDKTGNRIVTGSDDTNLKIWSLTTGYVIARCRGHGDVITDLAINCTGSMVASSSADRTVRVWSMENGAPIAVFIGHAAAVNGVSFAPNVSGRHNKAFNHLGLPAKRCLLSWSDDGTARLWEAKRKPDSDAIVYRTTPIFNGARKSCRLRGGAFSFEGNFFATCGDYPQIRIWAVNTLNSHRREICILEGHTQDVSCIQFAGHSNRLASCSRDGTIRVWNPVWHPNIAWEWTPALCVHISSPDWSCTTEYSDDAEEDSQSGDHKKRPSETLPGKHHFNMAVWTCDDSRILLSSSVGHCYSLDSVHGSSKMMLKGHSTECWVIEGHPWNPDLALSGGYDACVALWDLKSGKCLQKFSDTPCAITDGHWSPDGTGIAVIDSVGQLKVFGIGTESRLGRAPAQQFLQRDYHSLYYDEHGQAIDHSSDLPPHLLPPDLLCNIDMEVYMEPFQSDFQRSRIDAKGRLTEEAMMALSESSANVVLTAANAPVILRQMAEAQLQLQNVSGSDASSDDSDDEDFTVPLESTGADEVSDKSERDPDWEESPTKSDFDRSPSVEKRYRSRKRSCKKNGNTESTSLDDDLSQEESGEESGSISGEGCSTSGRQKRRKQLIHDSSEDEDDNQDDNAVMALAVLTRNRRRLAVERSAGGGVVEELVSGLSNDEKPEFYSHHEPRIRNGRPYSFFSWLRKTKPEQGSQYHPQLDDIVFYCPKGHAAYLRQCDFQTRETPFRVDHFKSLRGLEKCKVLSIEYEIGRNQRSVAVLKLMSIDADSRFHKDAFEVSLADMRGHAEFVVEEAVIRRAKQDWKPMDKCRVFWLESEASMPGLRRKSKLRATTTGRWFPAIVRGIAPADDDRGDSPWENIEVLYEYDLRANKNTNELNGNDLQPSLPQREVVRHSFWELYPEDGDAEEDEQSFENRERERLAPEERDELLGNVVEVQNNPEFKWFVAAEQWAQLDFYVDVIALPMDVELIYARLSSGFYRRRSSYEFDCNLIYSNAKKYNESNPLVVDVAKKMLSCLVRRK